MVKIGTEDQTADLATKLLPATTCLKHARKVMGVVPDDLTFIVFSFFFFFYCMILFAQLGFDLPTCMCLLPAFIFASCYYYF